MSLRSSFSTNASSADVPIPSIPNVSGKNGLIEPHIGAPTLSIRATLRERAGSSMNSRISTAPYEWPASVTRLAPWALASSLAASSSAILASSSSRLSCGALRQSHPKVAPPAGGFSLVSHVSRCA